MATVGWHVVRGRGFYFKRHQRTSLLTDRLEAMTAYICAGVRWQR